MKTPPIGQTVELYVLGEWRKDWVCMRRIDHGPDPQNAELGVMCWGADGTRHTPGKDLWREID